MGTKDASQFWDICKESVYILGYKITYSGDVNELGIARRCLIFFCRMIKTFSAFYNSFLLEKLLCYQRVDGASNTIKATFAMGCGKKCH